MSEYVRARIQPAWGSPFGKRGAPHQTSLSGVLDTIKDIGGGIVNFYGAGQQAQGANAVLTAQQQAMLAQQSGGISMTTVAIIGALGIGAIFLLKKKKAA